ncbi:entericidin A/B family lipoprotein [Novosphingobium sp. B 225]|nr:entericidin A/B family lipoprotein [Novosphingobium sp. B 225]
MIRQLIAALALTGLTLTASACNTVKGVGRDIQSVGEAGEKVVR